MAIVSVLWMLTNLSEVIIMTKKTNKTSRVNFNEIEVRNGNFVFSFNGENFDYECVFKKDLKGIAAERWTIDGKVHKIGIKKGCELLKIDEVEAIQLKRKNTLKMIRGDDSDEKRLEFEIKELESKLENYEEKMKKIKAQIKRKQDELKNVKAFKENSIDVDKLVKESKEKQIELLKQQLEKLETLES